MKSLSYGLFLFVLVFSPLAFGTVEYWSQSVLITATSISFLLLCTHLFLAKENFFIVPGIIPLLLLIAWMLFQLLPLPVSVVKIIAPSTYEIYRPLLEVNPNQNWINLTVNPNATALMFFTTASYALFFLLTVYHLHTSEKLKQTMYIVTILGSIIGIEAILQKLTSPEAIYWFRSTPSNSPVGPWVYSNHFAGFMEMILPLVIALFLAYRPQVQYEKTLKEKFIVLFTMPGANRYLLFGTAAILIAVSILFSLSRGGIITLCIAFLFFILFSAKATQDKRTKWVFILTISTILMVTWLGWQPIMDEFDKFWGENGLNTSGRLPVLLDSINTFKAYPFFGTGFGTFIDTYPAVRSIEGDVIFDHAHNDYIELLTDGGMLGFTFCAWFVLSLLIHTIHTMNRRRERYSILLASGALTGLLALLFHSFVDFQIYNGANALYFFFLCGLALSSVNTRFQFRSRPTLLQDGKPYQLIITSLLAFILLVTFSTYSYRLYKADQLTEPAKSTFINPNIPSDRLEEMHTLYAQATTINPLNAEYRLKLGEVFLSLKEKSNAIDSFTQACMLRPMSGFYLQQLGLSLEDDKKELQEHIIFLGIKREPLILARYLTYADWLVTQNRMADALRVLDRAFSKIPHKTQILVSYIVMKQFSRHEVETILAQRPSAWYAMGRLMEKRKQQDESIYYYLKAIESLEYGEILPSYFNSLYHIYIRAGERDKAVVLLRKGIENLPDYAPFRILLGDYYRQEGIRYRAIEEYQQAITLDPRNATARKRLKDMRSQ